MSAMDIDTDAALNLQGFGNLEQHFTAELEKYSLQARATIEAEASAWAAQKEVQIRNEAQTFVASELAQHKADLDQQAASHFADQKAELERQALAWKTEQERHSQASLTSKEDQLKRQYETNQSLSNELHELKNRSGRSSEAANGLEKQLRATISQHEEAAKKQQQDVAQTQAELQEMTSSKARLSERLASGQVDFDNFQSRGKAFLAQKDLEIASLKQEKDNIILQARGVIADKDARIKVLEEQNAKQLQRIGEDQTEHFQKIAKDLADQHQAGKRAISRLEDDLATSKAENEQYRQQNKQQKKQLDQQEKRLRQQNKQLRQQADDPSGDLAKAMGSLMHNTASVSGSKAPGGVDLGKSFLTARVGKAKAKAKPQKGPFIDSDDEDETSATAKAKRKKVKAVNDWYKDRTAP